VTNALSRVALGCYPLGGGYGQLSDAEAKRTIDAAIERGWTFFDTAEAYLESEERLGRLLGNRRDQVFLATKVFPCEPYTAANLRSAVEGSLRRLRTDHIDLYQLHGPENWVVPFDPTPLTEIGDTLARFRDEGKIGHIGVCNFSVDVLQPLDDSVGLFSMQDLYNLLDPGAEEDLPNLPSVSRKLRYAHEHDVRFIAYSPLARGLLTDGLAREREFPPDDERHYLPRYQRGIYEHFADTASILSAWAADHGRSLRQLAVAWCLHNPSVTSVLVGAKTAEQVEQISGAESWALSEADVAFVAKTVGDLPAVAREALVTVWDHVSEEALIRLLERRHAQPESVAKEARS
jgi:aryl-alcohol dehydrogenase-like predicted oxidoreductase